MEAKVGDTVKIHYTGKLPDGTVFDSSKDGDPLEFKLGENMVIPGLEHAIIAMNEGEEKTESIPTAEAYGDRKQELVFKVERESVPPDVELSVGLQLEIHQDDGNTFAVTVVQIDDDTITLDANHPLAGQDLIFEFKLIEVSSDSE